MEEQIILQQISKKYDDDVILENLNLDIYKNEFLTLLGPSGCGKTTTLRIIGGFAKPDSGKVLFEGKNITDLEPYRRNVNTVFQKYALFPNMNVFDNVAFGLRLKKVPKKEIEMQVHEMLHMVKMNNYEKRAIHELSGGQQQRIAIARALVNKPKVLLLDEPLGALDLKLRKRMQNELKNIQENLGLTFVYVTHDQEEALTMSDRIIIMDHGKIQQIGTPEDIYNEPVNRFVANFIGESDIFEGKYLGNYQVEFLGHIFTCVDRYAENEKVDVVIRPEDIEIYINKGNTVPAIVQSIRFKGVHYEIVLKTKDQLYIAHTTKYFQEGQNVGIQIIPDNIHLMKRDGDEI